MTPPSPPAEAQLAHESWPDSLAEFFRRLCKSEDLSERLDLASSSPEVTRVAEAINTLLDRLWANQFQLGAKREMLEKLLEIRTNEVKEILNGVSTGFLLALRDQTVLANYSHACTVIFGRSDIEGKKLSELLGLDPRERDYFAQGYEQIFEDVFPTEVALAQLPKEFHLHGRNYSIGASPIFSPDGRLVKLLFTMNDTTEMSKLFRENALRKALVEIIRQKDAFAACLCETRRAFAEARNSPGEHAFRFLLHTAKGNMVCFGLQEIAELIHAIEDAPEVTLRHLQTVEEALDSFLRTNREVLGLDYPESRAPAGDVTVNRMRGLLESLVGQDTQRARRALVDEFYRQSSWTKAGVLLAPLRGLFERVAERLGKRATLAITGEDLLVDPDRLGKIFANLGHLVRNSLDHGIEIPAERGAKPAVGRVTISCQQNADAWLIEVSDDGRGIDVASVCRSAVAKGVITAEALTGASEDERLALLFRAGLSSKKVATLDSGRGMGMAALYESIEAELGNATIHTVSGQGTQVTLRIPK